jgi:DNA-binding XRE family transcriptional regulator
MEKSMLEYRLRRAERRVSEGYAHIAQQRKILAELIQAGQMEAVKRASEILAQSEDIQASHIADRGRCSEELSALARRGGLGRWSIARLGLRISWDHELSLSYWVHQNMLQPHQIKAARELLGWSQKDCAKHAGITHETMRHLEVGGGHPRKDTIAAVLNAFEEAGVRVGEGGRLSLEPPDAVSP